MASAQVKSCALLAGLFADGVTTVIEKTPTRNHTEVMMRECGAAIEVTKTEAGERISVAGRKPLGALGRYTVAGDLVGVVLHRRGSPRPRRRIAPAPHRNQPSRTALIDALKTIGARVEIENPRVAHGEPVADILVRSSDLKGDLELSGSIIANLIDEIPILAIAGARTDGTLTVRDARELRVKESDRIRSIVDNLRRMGVEVEEFDDGLRLKGKQRLRGASAELIRRPPHRDVVRRRQLIAESETGSLARTRPRCRCQVYQLLATSGASIQK